MTNDEIAGMISSKLGGGKLISVTANTGLLPSFTVYFENEREERGSLTFQPALQTMINTGLVEIKARIEISIGDWRK